MLARSRAKANLNDQLVLMTGDGSESSDSDDDDASTGDLVAGGETVAKNPSRKFAFISGDTGLLSCAMHHNGTHAMESLFDKEVGVTNRHC
jgi:hypothetical protein